MAAQAGRPREMFRHVLGVVAALHAPLHSGLPAPRPAGGARGALSFPLAAGRPADRGAAGRPAAGSARPSARGLTLSPFNDSRRRAGA